MKARPYKDINEFVEVMKDVCDWPEHKDLKDDGLDDEYDCEETFDEVYDKMFPHLR